MNYILEYLSNTFNLALSYDNNIEKNVLESFANANYSCDIINQKPCIGCVIFFNQTFVVQCSRRHTKYFITSPSTKDIILLYQLFTNLGLPILHVCFQVSF
jgi:hypothetical protein